MAAQAARTQLFPRKATNLDRARDILRSEISALEKLSENLDSRFEDCLASILQCRGSVVVTGIGKAGHVAQKISASLASTGTPSHFLHPSEAVHGDLGSIRADDVVLILSYSGETEEVVRLLPVLRELASSTIAITGREQSTLAKSVDIALLIGEQPEAGELGIAPSSSTTMMMALGDALALVASECRGFTKQQFAKFHPAGNLGRQLANVKDIMRPLSECRVASADWTVRDVFVRVTSPGRRTGAIMLVDKAERLVGVFTDSDLARLLQKNGNDCLDEGVGEVMTRTFQTVSESSRFPEALRIILEFKISELPVVDCDGRPLGIIDITDVVGPDSTAAMMATTLETNAQGPTILSLVKP